MYEVLFFVTYRAAAAAAAASVLLLLLLLLFSQYAKECEHIRGFTRGLHVRKIAPPVLLYLAYALNLCVNTIIPVVLIITCQLLVSTYPKCIHMGYVRTYDPPKKWRVIRSPYYILPV